MKKIYLLAAAILLSLSVSAQSNYKPGYLLGLKGDTTRGYINYREWSENPSAIEFKNSLSGNDKKKILPTDIAAFSITGLTTYKTYSGPVSTDEISGNRLPNSRDTSVVYETIFLKVLQSGKNVTLYSYQDRIKARYFISDATQTPPTELIYHVYFSSDQQNGSINENTYKKQLSIIASKLNLLDDKLNLYIQRSEYNYSDMLSIASKLNDINTVQEDNMMHANYFYAGIGVNVASFTIGGEYEKAGGKPYTSILPHITGGFNFYADPNTQALAFRIEGVIGANRYVSNYANKVSPYNDVVFHFTQISFSITPQVLYNLYNAPNLKFYGAVGFQASYNQYIDKVFKNKDGSDFSSFRGRVFDFNKALTNIMFKVGTTINKKIDIYVNYITPSNINADDYFLMSNTVIQAGVNYSFK
jgi:hypothetical protein